MMTLSVSKYCSEVDAAVNITQVLLVATATAGATSMSKKKGENTKPPAIPMRHATQPVPNAMALYAKALLTDHPCVVTTNLL
jgi:hypothetical protein